jgi:2-oxoisovalerate dehydrogenase E2 component (dihydrolipoyl transacylase)
VSRFAFRLPDLGEGTVSAEIVQWLVKPGDRVREGQPVAEVSTEKAVVELPSPVSGEVLSLGGAPGDAIAVGAELMAFEAPQGTMETPRNAALPPSAAAAAAAATTSTPSAPAALTTTPMHVRASPATRRRAREAGVDLNRIHGTGPRGRIQAADLIQALQAASPVEVEEIKVIGVRRVIAQRMSAAKRSIPHFGYIEEVDVTELEALRLHLQGGGQFQGLKLTPLPFIVKAVAEALRRFPQCNAHYDEARETLLRYHAVHAGIATQTRDGLKVPVVRNAQSLSLRQLALEIQRVTLSARDNQATRDELRGSTITLTSLGKLGGVASTPIINAPEMAIIGVNRIAQRPVVHQGDIVIRQMMNLSSSFDHRFVDGFDAAGLIQAVKESLEHPATIFMAD